MKPKKPSKKAQEFAKKNRETKKKQKVDQSIAEGTVVDFITYQTITLSPFLIGRAVRYVIILTRQGEKLNIDPCLTGAERIALWGYRTAMVGGKITYGVDDLKAIAIKTRRGDACFGAHKPI
jgi:hypothetical protein